jgi:HD-like signal output (HDOD) protein
MRILLVDDDPQLLAGLRRTLRLERPQWHVQIADSGPVALTFLEGGAFTVLVTDMIMPDMDGAALLRLAHQASPGTVRMVLSGHTMRDRLEACEGLIHSFLDKPLDPDLMLEILDQHDPAKATASGLKAKALVTPLENVPSMPDLYQRLLQLLQEPNLSQSRLLQVIRQDPGMTAKVLKLANTGHAPRGRTSDLAEAMSLLGLETLKPALLMQSTLTAAQSLTPQGLRLEDHWRHSLHIAEATRFLAQHQGAEARTVAMGFTAGLLHDIGITILATHPSLEYQTVLDQTQSQARPLFEVEREHLGTDHAEVGAALLKLWGLEEELCALVRNHHDAPAPGASRTMAGYMAFADRWRSLFEDSGLCGTPPKGSPEAVGPWAALLERWEPSGFPEDEPFPE